MHFPRPFPVEEAEPAVTGARSFEKLLAVTLCFMVLVASVSLLETDRRISNALLDLPAETRTEPVLSLAEQRFERRLSRPPLCVVIALDGLRPDRTSLHGYERETTPRLDALAREAVVFEIVSAQSSHPLASGKSLLSGKYPSRIMFEERNADLFALASLENPQAFLLETFTAVATDWASAFAGAHFHGAYFSSAPTLDEGFADHAIVDDLESVLARGLEWLDAEPRPRRLLFLRGDDISRPDRLGPELLAFCPEHRPHADLEPPKQRTTVLDATLTMEEREHASDHYDGAVLRADRQLGDFLDRLRERELFEEALIIVTSTHGESLGERGHWGHGDLRLEELRVPLVIRFPTSWEVEAQRIDEPIELVDVLPTVVASCGVPLIGDRDGRSILPIVFRGVRGRDRVVAQTSWTTDAPSAAARSILEPDSWHVIHDAGMDRLEVFRLSDDPAALVDVSEEGDLDLPRDLRVQRLRPTVRSSSTNGSEEHVEEALLRRP